jgi:hypothetical protein
MALRFSQKPFENGLRPIALSATFSATLEAATEPSCRRSSVT